MTPVRVVKTVTWVEHKLEDGTSLWAKLDGSDFVRADGIFDANGAPAYDFKANFGTMTTSPPALRAPSDAKLVQMVGQPGKFVIDGQPSPQTDQRRATEELVGGKST